MSQVKIEHGKPYLLLLQIGSSIPTFTGMHSNLLVWKKLFSTTFYLIFIRKVMCWGLTGNLLNLPLSWEIFQQFKNANSEIRIYHKLTYPSSYFVTIIDLFCPFFTDKVPGTNSPQYLFRVLSISSSYRCKKYTTSTFSPLVKIFVRLMMVSIVLPSW